MELLRAFLLYIVPQNHVFAQYCACFMRKTTQSSLRIVNYNKRNDKQNKKLFLRSIALGFIAQNCAIFIAICFTQHAQEKSLCEI